MEHQTGNISRVERVGTTSGGTRPGDQAIQGFSNALAGARRRLAERGVRGDLLEEMCAECARRYAEAISRDPSAIDSPAAYGAALSEHVLADHLRQARPNWFRLKRRVIYLMDRGPDGPLCRWKSSREWLCGPVEWRALPFRLTRRYLSLCESTDEFQREGLAGAPGASLDLEDLLLRMLHWVETPIELRAIVSHAAAAIDLREPVLLSLNGSRSGGASSLETTLAEPTDFRDAVIDRLADVQYRAQIWEQVCALPLRQRNALLLAMDQEGVLLLCEGVCEVAKALEIREHECFALWAELPLTDKAIGTRLQAEPGQVSNLRKCARERLLRWIAKNRREA
jgi:hypothetical protein